MKLIDEVKSLNISEHEKWFNRWYEKEEIEKIILRASRKGFTGVTLLVSDLGDEYTKARLNNPLTIELLKLKLDGFDVYYRDTSGDKMLFNQKIGTWSKRVIAIEWEESK